MNEREWDGCAAPRHAHLRRLQREYYMGFASVHWVMTIRERQSGWLTRHRHGLFREALLHAEVRYGLLCPIYCLMPDHVHFIWSGIRSSADQLLAAAFLRRISASVITPFQWQKQAYDHVLTEKERERGAFENACGYILQNPVRAALVETAEEYPFTGSVLPGYPDVDSRRHDFWPVFWRIYSDLRRPATP